jgi:purine-binding chemotaxis protein CheW
VKGPAQKSAPEAVLLQLVSFRVGEVEYAVDIMRLKEIINPIRVLPVPKAPAFVEGVIELRGAILPVVDLRRRFDLPARPFERTTKFLIVGVEIAGRRMIVALVVDGVGEPIRVAKEQVRPAPVLARGRESYFSGVVSYRRAEALRGRTRRRGRRGPAAAPEEELSDGEDRMLVVLDVDALLSAAEKASLAGLGAEA